MKVVVGARTRPSFKKLFISDKNIYVLGLMMSRDI
jgi:hypothetical protein